MKVRAMLFLITYHASLVLAFSSLITHHSLRITEIINV